jgi:hypothetical protein
LPSMYKALGSILSSAKKKKLKKKATAENKED